MKHILILLYSVIVIMGAWAAFYTHQMYKKYKMTFLRDLIHYIIFFNMSVLFYQIIEYLYMNLLGNDLSNLHPFLRIFIYLVILIIQIGMTWTFIRVIMGLREKSVSKKIERIFYAGVAFIGINYTVGITLYLETTSSKWIDVTYVSLVILSWLVIYTALIMLVLRRQPKQGNGRKKAIKAFGTFYLLYYTAFFISIALPPPFNLYGPSGLLFLSNLIPIFWLRQYFLKYFVIPSSVQGQLNLDAFTQEFHISKREREIIELILQGKSNKEIEDALFISFNTVKNHIYNLYQKLGVNSRGQLMHFILNVQKRQEKKREDDP